METEEIRKTADSDKKTVNYRKRLTVFLICLIFSSIFWLINNLSGYYDTTIYYPIKYTGFPKGKILLEEPNAKLAINVKAQGYRLLKYNLFESPRPISLNLSALQYRKVNNSEVYYIATKNFYEEIANQLGSKCTLNKVSVDTIYLKFGDLVKKTLPVVLVSELITDKKYRLTGDIVVSPSRVTVSGVRNIIDTMTAVYTQLLVKKDIKNDFVDFVEFYKDSKNEHLLSYDFNGVKVSGNVQKCTEEFVSIVVECINAPEKVKIKAFPEKVKVKYRVNLTDYDKVSPGQFRVVLDYNKIDKLRSANPVKPDVIAKPDFIDIIKLEPERVEYLIYR